MLKAMKLDSYPEDTEENEHLADLTGIPLDDIKEMADWGTYLVFEGEEDSDDRTWFTVPWDKFPNDFEFVGEETHDFVEVIRK